MAKPTKAALARRVARVSELLLRGASRGVIIQYVAEKTDWSVIDRTVDNYIQKATEKIRESAVTDTDYEIGKAKERYEFLWNKAVTMQDFREARGVQKDRSGLLGLEAPKKTEILGDVKGEVIIKYEQNDNNIAEDARGAAKDKE